MKKLTKRLLSCCMAATMVASLATGCSNNKSSSTATAQQQTKSGTKQIVAWIAGTDEELAYYKKMFSEIDEKNPGFTIKVVTQSKLQDSLNAAINSNDLPDISQVDGTQISTFKFDNVLMPIDSYLTSATKSDMLPSITNEITETDGKVYAIGQFDSGLSLWANKSLLQKAGVRIPTSYKNAWTKTEFEDALKKLKTVCKYPLDISQDDKTGQVLYYTYLPIVKSFGGDWMNKSTKVTSGTLNGKATVSALSYITWLEKNGYINATQDYTDGFYNKKESALSLLGHWMAPKFTQGLGKDAILIPIPNFGDGVYTGIGSSCWSMMSAAKNHGVEKECGTILESMMDSKYVKGICDANGAVPALKSVLDSDPLYKTGGQFYLYREQLEGGIGYSRPKTPATVYMCSEIGKAIANVISGQDAQAALDNASKNIDNNIKQNNYNSK